ncbi:uncharacterized protein LOC117124173 isoform X2 [Anneissia japonica]|uniref:uncharacterized protein LOC117124173 isoform X1 n=1 Tax=Anneissia japonica TaxID=1529436 RepID=UPI00142561B1|nr:uncharacterized protein LOC117124173 isoform X1 [Anneissia japonica]XP_033126215.1 uncharacterized protein LOC117124173 isoform X2 [Anneissia japonica]
MLTELPELKEEEKMMEKIERKLNGQLIRLREEEIAIKRLIREGNTSSTHSGLLEDNEIYVKEIIPSLNSITQRVARLSQGTNKSSIDTPAAGELAVNKEPLSCLSSSLIPDEEFSEEEDEDEEEDEEGGSSQNLMALWKSMGQD